MKYIKQHKVCFLLLTCALHQQFHVASFRIRYGTSSSSDLLRFIMIHGGVWRTWISSYDAKGNAIHFDSWCSSKCVEIIPVPSYLTIASRINYAFPREYTMSNSSEGTQDDSNSPITRRDSNFNVSLFDASRSTHMPKLKVLSARQVKKVAMCNGIA